MFLNKGFFFVQFFSLKVQHAGFGAIMVADQHILTPDSQITPLGQSQYVES